jgi:transcriptional regulator with XRE-family HTH domain
MNFAKALKRTMLEFDITGVELSRRSGISKNTISAFRQGGQSLTVENLEKLLGAMPEDARAFFFRELECGEYQAQDASPVA